MAKSVKKTQRIEMDAEGKKTVVIDVEMTDTSAERWDLASITGQRAALALDRNRLLQEVAKLDARDAELAEMEALLTA